MEQAWYFLAQRPDTELLWTWRISVKAERKSTLIKTGFKNYFSKMEQYKSHWLSMDLIFSFLLWSIAHSMQQFLYPCFLKCPLDKYATVDVILESLADLIRNCTKWVNESWGGRMTDKELDATFILGSGIIWNIHRLAAVLTIFQFPGHNRHPSLK